MCKTIQRTNDLSKLLVRDVMVEDEAQIADHIDQHFIEQFKEPVKIGHKLVGQDFSKLEAITSVQVESQIWSDEIFAGFEWLL